MLKKLNPKQLFEGIGMVMLYFVLLILFQIPFLYISNNEYIQILGPYFLLAFTFIIMYIKELKRDFIDFKKNHKKIILTTLKCWLIGFVIMYLSNILINLLPVKEVVNQQENINLLKTYPIIEIIFACFLAPIIEEITFRLSFNKFTTNKWLYAITTGLIFGGIHLISTISSTKNIIDLIYIIPYASLGIAFGYSYAKTDNIYGTLLFHALHNTLSILEFIIIGGIIL